MKRVLGVALSGAVAGMAGAVAMNLANRAFRPMVGERGPRTRHARLVEQGGRKEIFARPHQLVKEPTATERTADLAFRLIADRRASRAVREAASPVIHLAFGAGAGAVYASAAAVFPLIRAAGGAGYGVALWFAADEIALPAAGLSRPASKYPASARALSLASHLVWVCTTELVLRGIERMSSRS